VEIDGRKINAMALYRCDHEAMAGVVDGVEKIVICMFGSAYQNGAS
jgi:hypothetical protein